MSGKRGMHLMEGPNRMVKRRVRSVSEDQHDVWAASICLAFLPGEWDNVNGAAYRGPVRKAEVRQRVRCKLFYAAGMLSRSVFN